MSLTPTSQRNAVSEGMALGLVMCDRTALPYDKVGIDRSFTGAWRSWRYRTCFPQVNTDLSKGLDGVWSAGQIDAEHAAKWIDGDVPAEGRRELAAAFLQRFEPTD